jgi:hypothetical protein
MRTYTYTDPGGRNLTVSGDFEQELRVWQSEFAITTPLDGRVPDSYRTRQLSVTHLENHDDWLADRKASMVGEYAVSAGTLQIWRPADPRSQGLARWQGKYHAAVTYLPFQQWENHDFVLGYFSGMQLVDTPTGLKASTTASRVSLTVLNVSALIAGTGLFEVFRPEIGLGYVPPWSGAQVDAGEVWAVHDDATDPSSTDHLIMSSPTAVATAVPGAGASLDDCLTFLSKVSVLTYQGAGK